MYLTKIQFTHFSGVSFFFSKGKFFYALSVLLHYIYLPDLPYQEQKQEKLDYKMGERIEKSNWSVLWELVRIITDLNGSIYQSFKGQTFQ